MIILVVYELLFMNIHCEPFPIDVIVSAGKRFEIYFLHNLNANNYHIN